MGSEQVQWIAEVSSNHHQDLVRCFRFIDVAADIGCAAVKFQLFDIDRMFAPEILCMSALHRARRAWELPVAFLPLIAERCQFQKLQFICSPFYLDAVAELLPYVHAYKIASYELPWDDLLRACAKTGKPIILSTGMATVEEIQHAVDVLEDAECEHLTLLHCVSGYPTPTTECNLAAMDTMERRFCFPVGLSDHSHSPAVLYRAVHRWDAKIVEFHLDLDGAGDEFKTGHCWLPAEIAPVIQTIRDGFSADGTGIKQPMPSETADVAWRRDPEDGLRPMRATREAWVGDGE